MYQLMFVDVFYALVCLLLVKMVTAAVESFTCALDENSLRQNLERLGQLYDLQKIQNICFEKDDVIGYYDNTTELDYKVLQLCSGTGLHSKLLFAKPVLSVASTSAQAALVLKEIGHVRAKNVLEIGCGQGFCTAFLATLCPHVVFHGIDIVQKHIEIATKNKELGRLTNTKFSLCDATRFDNLASVSLDLIFSVEALCHLDTSKKRHDFLSHAYNRLCEHGRIVIIDGFRSFKFEQSSVDQQTAMRLAETGFRIRNMPAKKEWIDLARDLNFELIEDRDLTQEVMPFWEKGWRMACFVLQFSFVLKYLKRFNFNIEETTGNFLSIATTAHAFRDRGTAEYGIIILQKKKSIFPVPKID